MSITRNFLSRSPHVFFSFFFCLAAATVQQPLFKLFPSRQPRTVLLCVWAGEYACVCARSEQRDTVVRKPLYPYVAHQGKFWNIYGSARGVNCNNCGKSFQLHIIFFTTLAAAVFQVQQQQPSKRRGCHGTTAAHQAFPFVTATNGASPCGFVSVRTCARRANSIIYTVVLKYKPVRGAPWQIMAYVQVCTTVSASEVFNRCNIAVKSFQCSDPVRLSRVTKRLGMMNRAGGGPLQAFCRSSTTFTSTLL